MSGMMLADSPKYSKKRNGGIAAQLSRLTGKQMCYVAFILLNVVWFAASLVSVLRKKHTQNQMLRQQQQQQQHMQGNIGLAQGIGTNQNFNRGGGGGSLFGGIAGGAQAGAGQQGAGGGGNGVFEELTARHTLTAGGLKISGNVLAASSGKLLISADAIGIGTRMLEESDKLVVNGPIRLADSGHRPSCDQSMRGMIFHDFGEPGSADNVAVCAKDATDAYEWRDVYGGKGGGGGGGGGASGLTRSFPVAHGEVISPGDVVSLMDGQIKKGFGVQVGIGTVFMDGAMGGGGNAWKKKVLMAALSPSKFVVIMGSATGSSQALVGSVSGSRSEFKGGRAPFGPSKLEHFVMAPMSERTFAVAYPDPSNNQVGTLVVGEMVPSLGVPGFCAPVTFTKDVAARSVAVASLSASVLVLAYNQQAFAGSGHGHGRLALAFYANKKVTIGEAADVIPPEADGSKVASTSDGYTLATLTPERFVLAYRNLKSKNVGVRIGNVVRGKGADSLDTAALSVEATISSEGKVLTYLTVAAMSSTRIAVVYADGGQGSVVIGDVSGGSISLGQPVRFTGTKPLSVAASPLNSASFAVTYYTNNPWRAVVLIGDCYEGEEGPTAHLSESVLSSAYSTHTQVAGLGGSSFLAAFYDGANGDAGTVVVGQIGMSAGVAAGEGVEGQQVPIVFAGVSQGHSGLQAGNCVYAQHDGTVTATKTATPLGLAVSDGEIMLGACKY